GGMPGVDAQPPFSTKAPCDHESAFFSAARLPGTSGPRWKRSTQTGASATTTAGFACRVASASALPPVTHPPHVNPTIAAAIAPPAIPQATGFVSTGIFLTAPLYERGG